jgi:hypothetical protein
MPWLLPSAYKRLTLSFTLRTCRPFLLANFKAPHLQLAMQRRQPSAFIAILTVFLIAVPSRGQVATASAFKTETQTAVFSGISNSVHTSTCMFGGGEEEYAKNLLSNA